MPGPVADDDSTANRDPAAAKIGPAPHGAARFTPDNRRVAAGELDNLAVLDDVRRLCDAPAVALADVDRVLTDGYACVLRTEDERRRLRGCLQERAAKVAPAGTRAQVLEIRKLAQGIARADGEIEELRAALSVLAARASSLRAAAGTPVQAMPLRTA